MNSNKQSTLILIKPDGIQKQLVGPILTKFAEANLDILAAKVVEVSRELAEIHYEALKGKPFFEELIAHIRGELHVPRVLAMVLYGEDAIQSIRKICGATNPEDADPWSIRGSFGRVTTKGVYENVVHSSSDEKEAEREIKLWFSPEEIAEVELYPTQETPSNSNKLAWA